MTSKQGSHQDALSAHQIQQRPIQIESFESFPVNQVQKFDISIASHIKANDLVVTISNPVLGLIDKQIELIHGQQTASNKCRVSFIAPVVGIYTINVDFVNQTQYGAQFQAKAYDLSKVFIYQSSDECFVNRSYEFSVDASEAGEGQLEIAVNEGEIPNQVQVLDNGKCIVNFVPEDNVPHVVDIKFNGHNVNGCPFVVKVKQENDVSESPINNAPKLIKEERFLVDSTATFSIENIRLSSIDKNDLLIIDPENQPVNYRLIEDAKIGKYKFEFLPSIVGDYSVELDQKSRLFKSLPADISEQFPFLLKVFDFSKVLVSDITDGVVGHPVYFFIDASMAGSGNLEIRVSSKTRNVPNYPQSEANAKIRVNFTPTEAVDHSIDVKFNGIPVPGNQFLVKVAQYPQARVPVISQDLLKYVAIDEFVSFYVDYIGTRENNNVPEEDLSDKSCQVHVLKPDFSYIKLNSVELQKSDTSRKHLRFKVGFRPKLIGPYKLFITVNNEILPSSPIISNVYNIDEVKVYFETYNDEKTSRPVGHINKPVVFTVDASRAGEGTLALAVVSGMSRSPVQTDVKVSDKGHGLYNLVFVPTECAQHSIDMSFNDRVVPSSPFVVDILDSNGKLPETSKISEDNVTAISSSPEKTQMVQNFKSLNLKDTSIKQLNKTSAKQVTTSRKSIAYGLINASNIVYLESGVLEDDQNQVSLIGPNNEKVPFLLAKESSQPGEPKKTYLEYKPKIIGTHTINVLDDQQELRQYFVSICNPSLIKINGLDKNDLFFAGKPVTFYIDSRESGDTQIDSITILGPKKANSKVRDGDQTILGRIKSISSSSSNNQPQSIEYSLTRLDDHQQEVKFVPPVSGKYSIDIRCLGQSVESPLEIEVKNQSYQDQHQSSINAPIKDKHKLPVESEEEELLRNIVVHGMSLKCSPVNSTGAFIIETNGLAQARDFDVLITDPSNSLMDVQCYLQQDGNLLAEWTPKRVGRHKIEVIYRDKQIPGSPFITEVFDPSGVIISDISGTICTVNDEVTLKLNREKAGSGKLDVAVTSPVGQDLPIDIRPLDNEGLGEIISFTPSIAGKYRMSITFGGYEVPKGCINFTVKGTDDSIKVSGVGLKCAEVNRTAQFVVESLLEGEFKLRIESGTREIVPKIEKCANSYIVKYKPTDVGYATISLYWNGAHIEASPYTVPVNDLSKILFLSGTNKSSISNNQRTIDYEAGVPKEITVDTSRCGPGELKVDAYCRANPAIKFSIPASQYVLNRYRLVFICPPKTDQLAKGISQKEISTEATYLIRFYYNNLIVPETLASVIVSPYQTFPPNNHLKEVTLSRSKKIESNIRQNLESENNNNNSKPLKSQDSKSSFIPEDPINQGVDCPIVALRGHGLAEAKCGERAEFTIDGSEAGPGEPEIRFNSLTEELKVQLTQINDKLYRASYVPQTAGVYSLNVLWDGKQVAGCPISVSIIGDCDPSKVICSGDGLKGGVLGEEIKTFIDTRRAGPGELTALCTGPHKVAFCELLDRGDGTFILYIRPQEPGRQFLTIKYGGQHIPNSPFSIKVSGKPDPSKVRVHGPGVEHGVLSLYQSRFVCDTRGAGAGQLTVRIRGPKGAFRMETQRESQRDRTILCKYDPTEPGDYRIEIKWSGHHVPGSPFSVMIFDTQEELSRFINEQTNMHSNNLVGRMMSTGRNGKIQIRN